jgi:CheY-like chemotaxis protein
VYSVLESGGYDVLAASNAPDGLNICRQSIHPIALLIPGCNMPQMSGLELARECPTLSGDLSVLYISDFGPDDELQAELRTPRRGFLGKPFRSYELPRKAKQLLLG